MKDWENDKYVKNWFALLGNERTIKNYKGDFPRFLKYVEAHTPCKTPTDIIESRLQHLTSQNLIERRFWEMQTIKFKNYMETKNLRMATVKGYIRTVQSFFSKNGVKLSFSRGELKINPSEKDKVYREWIPSNEEIRLIYRLCASARDRGILLMLYQSGFSEVDVANMQIQQFPFYSENGDWQLNSNEDLFYQRRREKTNQWQKTIVNRECLEEIRIYLQSRGFPREGFLFESFRGEQLGVRGINMMLKRVVEKGFNGRVKEWKTKHLRDAFMNGLLQARVTQEVKDAMVGHKRHGAREDYALTEQTIKVAYESAFKFLTINGYGSTSRKLEQLENKFNEQNKTLLEMMTEIREENKQLKAEQQEFKEALEAIKEAARKRAKQ
jgi:site-specific recombinase XerC